MRSKGELVRSVSRAANGVPMALQALNELRQAVLDGKPLSSLLACLDEATEAVIGIEAVVGVVTPMSLFE